MSIKAVSAILIGLVACANFEEIATAKAITPIRPPRLWCPEHEYSYFTCRTTCQGTCNNTFPICRKDISVCRQFCLCKPGYVREVDHGPCIPIRQCKANPPSSCGPNEERANSSSSCQPTCTNPSILGCEGNQELCVCKEGFVRVVRDGACVPEDRCPDTCRENETWNDCGSACPPICNKPTLVCIQSCLRGCFCKKGFILDEAGQCISENLCPKISNDV